MSRCMSGNAVAKTSTIRPRSLPRYSVPDATSRITPSAVNNDTNVLMSLTLPSAAAYPDRMIASFFDMSQEVYGHVLWDVLNVYADFDGSGRRCSRRHAAGDVPVTLLNTLVKWLCSAKPVTSATSERGRAPERRSS